ncbi:hypothetical protein C7B80_30085 [Cyanosarcina cf. burmensis CCALA 770]|nr:hypothetical protein C7B80_30085 [Cyanosarcina cf. burmensis CCALA 770]
MLKLKQFLQIFILSVLLLLYLNTSALSQSSGDSALCNSYRQDLNRVSERKRLLEKNLESLKNSLYKDQDTQASLNSEIQTLQSIINQLSSSLPDFAAPDLEEEERGRTEEKQRRRNLGKGLIGQTLRFVNKPGRLIEALMDLQNAWSDYNTQKAIEAAKLEVGIRKTQLNRLNENLKETTLSYERVAQELSEVERSVQQYENDVKEHCSPEERPQRDSTIPTQPQNPGMSSIQWNIDRPGLDYRKFNLEEPEPKLCLDACSNDPNCKAWTYVKPNTTQGPKPRCWLKYAIPSPREGFCCASGTKK